MQCNTYVDLIIFFKRPEKGLTYRYLVSTIDELEQKSFLFFASISCNLFTADTMNKMGSLRKMTRHVFFFFFFTFSSVFFWVFVDDNETIVHCRRGLVGRRRFALLIRRPKKRHATKISHTHTHTKRKEALIHWPRQKPPEENPPKNGRRMRTRWDASAKENKKIQSNQTPFNQRLVWLTSDSNDSPKTKQKKLGPNPRMTRQLDGKLREKTRMKQFGSNSPAWLVDPSRESTNPIVGKKNQYGRPNWERPYLANE